MNLRKIQRRLKRIAKIIGSGSQLSEQEKLFLSDALLQIADGRNADEALGVKGKKGVAKGAAARNNQNRKMAAMAWISTARKPLSDGGYGLTLDQACSVLAGEIIQLNTDQEAAIKADGGIDAFTRGSISFGFTASTLQSYWSKNPDIRGDAFHLED